MIVDQSEIEALLAQADKLVAESEPDPPPAQPVQPVQPPLQRVASSSPEIARLLKIKVPVIVELATRRMHISQVRKLSLGMIIEFDKSIDDPLRLLINNHPIGDGEAVKVGECFGLRVCEMCDSATRIKSMG